MRAGRSRLLKLEILREPSGPGGWHCWLCSAGTQWAPIPRPSSPGGGGDGSLELCSAIVMARRKQEQLIWPGSGVPTCAQTGLCAPGPDNRLHSSPTSVTSFADMSPERTFKGLISCGSDDMAFPLLPLLWPGYACPLLSWVQSWWPTPVLPLGCFRGPHVTAGLMGSSVGLSEHGAGRVQGCPGPVCFWGATQSVMEPSCGLRDPTTRPGPLL